MKITGQTTFAELAAERARLGIEWMVLIHNDADDQRVRVSGALTIGGVVMGFGDNFESAFARLFEAAERAIARHAEGRGVSATLDHRSKWTVRCVTHEIIDTDDDHRILISRCNQRFHFVPAIRRELQGSVIDCARCEALQAIEVDFGRRCRRFEALARSCPAPIFNACGHCQECEADRAAQYLRQRGLPESNLLPPERVALERARSRAKAAR